MQPIITGGIMVFAEWSNPHRMRIRTHSHIPAHPDTQAIIQQTTQQIQVQYLTSTHFTLIHSGSSEYSDNHPANQQIQVQHLPTKIEIKHLISTSFTLRYLNTVNRVEKNK
jgi:hypothetical protein